MKIRDKKWKKLVAANMNGEQKTANNDDEFLEEGEEVFEPESDKEEEVENIR